jgi:hypothetical protein
MALSGVVSKGIQKFIRENGREPTHLLLGWTARRFLRMLIDETATFSVRNDIGKDESLGVKYMGMEVRNVDVNIVELL